MKILLTAIFLITALNLTLSQPRDYWQQTVDVTIKVTLDDRRHVLSAFETISYTNNSPDELKQIYMHLWPNAYQGRNTAFAKQQIENNETEFYFSEEEAHGYIDSLAFRINGQDVYWEYHRKYADVAVIVPTKPVKPGETIKITTPFRVKLPESFSRLGHVHQQYQITQWYPKPAVYDQNGWHPMPYLDQGEFYSEFGTFDVSITLPANYVVGATGTLQNPDEREFLQRKSQVADDLDTAPFLASATEEKTIRYLQENVHDFAWFADKRYEVRTGKITLPNSGREVDLLALYNPENAALWADIIRYMQDAIYYYSLWIGDYAYPSVTVVDGALSAGAGMEYPMITVLGAETKFDLELVTMHEIGHNWFYGILGSNERRYPWLDEGINSFYELRYIRQLYPDRKLLGIEMEDSNAELLHYFNVDLFDHYKANNLFYLLMARQNLDQPINLPAPEFSNFNYFSIIYSKAAVVFDHLFNYLGPELFDRAMQEYYRQYKFKHPYPKDLRRIFEEETNKDLSWFFDDLIATDQKLNYDFVSAKKSNDVLTTRIKNKTSLKAPFPLMLEKSGSTLDTLWLEGFAGDQKFQIDTDADRLIIDKPWVTTELYRKNNYIKTHGPFKRSKPLEIKFLTALPNPEVMQLFFLPVFGANTTDKFLGGMAFYNSLIPERKFNYLLAPMFSFGQDKLTGTGLMSYSIYPGNFLREVKFKLGASAFAGYEKLNPEVQFIIQPQVRYSPHHRISFSYPIIRVDQNTLPGYEPSLEIFRTRYELKGGNAIFSFRNQLEFQEKADDFSQISNAFKFSWQHHADKYLDLRLFYGNFLQNKGFDPVYNFYLGGSTDYLMNEVFLDRAGISPWLNAISNQTDLEQGGFKGFISQGSDQWIASLNAHFDFPNISLFSLFADVGFLGGENEPYFDAGISFRIIRDILEIYVPLAGSPFEGAFPEEFREVQHNLRFRLNLNALNPLHLIEENLR